MRNTEVWKPINDDFSRDRYEVSSFGNIRRINNKRHRKFRINSGGYCQLNLTRSRDEVKSCRVHVLVAKTFLGDPNGLFVNHIDGDKTNNRLSNLEYVNRRENITHARKARFVGTSRCKKSGKWRSQIGYDRKRKHLGLFENRQDAADRYRQELEILGLKNKYAQPPTQGDSE